MDFFEIFDFLNNIQKCDVQNLVKLNDLWFDFDFLNQKSDV